MTVVTPELLYVTIDVTWPAKSITHGGMWWIREGGGGGKRVSAANLVARGVMPDIDTAEQDMSALNQPALFMIRHNDSALDHLLAERGYHILDPSVLYAAPIEHLINTSIPPITVFELTEPLAIQRDIWADGGIGAGRLHVMDRATGPKTTLLGRSNGRAAGTAFVAMGGPVAMIHALEVKASFRKQGMATHLTRAAAHWAARQGATHLTLVTTRANEGANALYSGLGFQVVGHYHYRIHPKDMS